MSQKYFFGTLKLHQDKALLESPSQQTCSIFLQEILIGLNFFPNCVAAIGPPWQELGLEGVNKTLNNFLPKYKIG